MVGNDKKLIRRKEMLKILPDKSEMLLIKKMENREREVVENDGEIDEQSLK